jgi:integrase
LQLLVSSSRREDSRREVCNKVGVRGFSARGLRKASMTRLAKAGCSVHEIQAFSGHKTLSEIAHYTSSVEQAALARKAMAKTPTKLSKPVGHIVKKRENACKNNG